MRDSGGGCGDVIFVRHNGPARVGSRTAGAQASFAIVLVPTLHLGSNAAGRRAGNAPGRHQILLSFNLHDEAKHVFVNLDGKFVKTRVE